MRWKTAFLVAEARRFGRAPRDTNAPGPRSSVKEERVRRCCGRAGGLSTRVVEEEAGEEVALVVLEVVALRLRPQQSSAVGLARVRSVGGAGLMPAGTWVGQQSAARFAYWQSLHRLQAGVPAH